MHVDRAVWREFEDMLAKYLAVGNDDQQIRLCLPDRFGVVRIAERPRLINRKVELQRGRLDRRRGDGPATTRRPIGLRYDQ